MVQILLCSMSFFEKQYEQLAEAVDTIAERLRAMKERTPGSFSEFSSLKTLPEAKPEEINVQIMLQNLISDHTEIHRNIGMLLEQARKEGDEVTQDLLIERLKYHEKILWMLRAHTDSA